MKILRGFVPYRWWCRKCSYKWVDTIDVKQCPMCHSKNIEVDE